MPKLYGGLDAGPLLIFDKSGSVLVISAFDNFMAASYEHDVEASTVSWGIMGKVDSIPKGFQYSTIMYYSSGGINKVTCSLSSVYVDSPCDVVDGVDSHWCKHNQNLMTHTVTKNLRP